MQFIPVTGYSTALLSIGKYECSEFHFDPSECAQQFVTRSFHCQAKGSDLTQMAAGIIIGLSLGFIIFVIIAAVVYMKRRADAGANVGYVISEGRAPVVVTSATHTAPGGYTVTQIPATTYQPQTFGTPYPAQTTGNVTVQMPMPMPGAQQPMPGMPPHVVAYPPMPQPGAGAVNMNPPSYDMAMATAGPTVMPPGGYEKQMPYNPNYAQ